MRELFEICPKIQFFNFSGALRGVKLAGKDVKWCVLICQGQSGKISCLSPEKMTIFLHLALFFYLSPQKSGTPTHFRITFSKST